jgi:thiol-disulfide isomerase/thioredoxin
MKLESGKRKLVVAALVAVALAAGAAGVFYGIGANAGKSEVACATSSQQRAAALKGLAQGDIAALAVKPRLAPALSFKGPDGQAMTLADFKGRALALNLWATWCVPCRKEMPALEALEEKLGGRDFEVVAVNIDTRDPDKPKNFLKDANLTKLDYFTDQKAKVFQDLKSVGRALGMPTSVLVDGQGCEIATIAGPAEWDSDDAVKLIKAAVNPVAAGF